MEHMFQVPETSIYHKILVYETSNVSIFHNVSSGSTLWETWQRGKKVNVQQGKQHPRERERGRDRETKRTCILVPQCAPQSKLIFKFITSMSHEFSAQLVEISLIRDVRTRTRGPARSEVFLGDFPTSTRMGATVGGPKKRGLCGWMRWELQTQRQRHRKVIEKILFKAFRNSL